MPVFAPSSAFGAETVMDFLYGKSVSDGERCRFHVLRPCLRKELGCIFLHSYPSSAMAASKGSFILACKAVGVRYADRLARRAAIRRMDRPRRASLEQTFLHHADDRERGSQRNVAGGGGRPGYVLAWLLEEAMGSGRPVQRSAASIGETRNGVRSVRRARMTGPARTGDRAPLTEVKALWREQEALLEGTR